MYNHTATNPFSIAFDVLTAPNAKEWYYQQVEAGAARHIAAVTATPIVIGYGLYQAALAAYNLVLFIHAQYATEEPTPLSLPPAKSWLQRQVESGQPIEGDIEKSPTEILAMLDNEFRFGTLVPPTVKPTVVPVEQPVPQQQLNERYILQAIAPQIRSVSEQALLPPAKPKRARKPRKTAAK
ncbi:MAG: hypothetical protein ACRC62_12320 [Microcoleus sp.]